MNLFNQLYDISELIPADFGGGSSISKTYLMAYLILRNNIKTYVEIGVYKGKSLFPVTCAIKENNGFSYGIDPYNKDAAREIDVDEDFQKQIDEFIDKLDYESVYQNVVKLKSKLGFENHLQLIRKKSSKSAEFFQKNNISINMLHIDGNHDTKYVLKDIELFLPLLNQNSIIVMDDIDWDSVKPAYKKLKKTATVIFESTTFAILINNKISDEIKNEYEFELNNIYDVIEVLTEKFYLYKQNLLLERNNAVNYLEELNMEKNETINSLETNLNNLTDKLNKLNENLLIKDKNILDLKSTINILAHSKKSDFYRNFQILFSEYLFDKLIPKKSRLAQLSNIPYLYILLKSKGNIKKFLVNINGYRAINRLELFDELYYLNKYKNILISGMNPLIHYIYYGYKENKQPSDNFDGTYYLNQYESVNSSGMNPLVHYSLYGINEDKKINDNKNSKNSYLEDLIILDDIFPHPLSAFKLQEYNSYLEYFNKTKIYSQGGIHSCFNETNSSESIIKNYEKKYPQFKGKVKKFNPNNLLQTKVVYTIFLNNVFYFIDIIEKYKVPFVFTLYPGGGFELNDELSDKKLKRIFSSPYFRNVIVTQRITKDYLIENSFCKNEQIKEIFGLVTPLVLLNKEYNIKKYYGRDKNILDICFVAYKYTKKGEDKGYDMFIDVAHALSKKYDTINFHVVGGFDENVLDITQIKDKITFYGPKSSEWFDDFYKDKDIILSPNIPFKMFDGHFDGFPTGCCTDAGLHKVAIFCTDELKLNTKFSDDEIVIIPHDSRKIIEIIENYYQNPKKLQRICENGYSKIKELYKFENQIKPRIKILEDIMDNYEVRNSLTSHNNVSKLVSNQNKSNKGKIFSSTKEPIITGFFVKSNENTPNPILKLDNETFIIIQDTFCYVPNKNKTNNNNNLQQFKFIVPINYIDGKRHKIQLLDETTDELIDEKELVWNPNYNLDKIMKNHIEKRLEQEKTDLLDSEIKLNYLQNEKTKFVTLSTHQTIKKMDSLKLNIGCGSVKLSGWINIDIEPNADLVLDVTNGLPFKDNSTDYIYNEHFIEHLNFEVGQESVKEFARVLKVGGVLRIATPDLDYIIGKYNNEWKNQDWLTWPEYHYIKTKGEMMNISMREWGHEYLYNEEDLRNLLEKVGFKKITKQKLNISNHPELSNLETRKDSRLILEAEK